MLNFCLTKHHKHLNPSVSFKATTCIKPGLLLEHIKHEVRAVKHEVRAVAILWKTKTTHHKEVPTTSGCYNKLRLTDESIGYLTITSTFIMVDQTMK